jgi:hypothetical protein
MVSIDSTDGFSVFPSTEARNRFGEEIEAHIERCTSRRN